MIESGSADDSASSGVNITIEASFEQELSSGADNGLYHLYSFSFVSIVHCIFVATMRIDSEHFSDHHEKSAGISITTTNKASLEDEVLDNVSDGNAANSEASSDLLNNVRSLIQSQDLSVDLYSEHKIIHESTPIQLGGFFAALFHMIRRAIFSLLLLN